LIARLYRAIARSPLGALLRSKPVQLVKQAFVSMPPGVVLEVMAALEAAGVRAWLIGGWAVDALIGEQTRRHGDLDVAFEDTTGAESRARTALEGLGYRFVRREPVAERIWPERIVMSGRRARVVDLHALPLRDGVVLVRTGTGEVVLRPEEAFAAGTIAGRPVPCISPRLQVDLHRGYETAAKDDRDLAMLRERLGASE
jgi:lincosamide nucleotidyltransferase A/C/D/E